MQKRKTSAYHSFFEPRFPFLVKAGLLTVILFIIMGHLPGTAWAEPASPPVGSDKVTVRVFVDRGCAAPFQYGIDVPLRNVRVKLSFADGSSIIRRTASSGMVYFAGIDASQGVTVSLLDLADMRFRGQYLNACNPTTVHLPAQAFQDARVGHRHVDFRVTPSLSPWPFR